VERAQRLGAPEAHFRFSGRCVQSRCKQWSGTRCGVIDRQLGELGDLAVGELPECSIRSDCRWFRQTGAVACAACPLVLSIPPQIEETEEEHPAALVPLGMDRLQKAPAAASTPAMESGAEAAARRYFDAFSRQDWDAVLSLHAFEFFARTPRDLFQDTLERMAEKLGACHSRQLQGRQVQTYDDLGRSRQVATLTYQVHYEHGEAAEALTFLQTRTGDAWQILSHQINSPALLAVTPGVVADRDRHRRTVSALDHAAPA
jgi:hypothetical protein